MLFDAGESSSAAGDSGSRASEAGRTSEADKAGGEGAAVHLRVEPERWAMEGHVRRRQSVGRRSCGRSTEGVFSAAFSAQRVSGP